MATIIERVPSKRPRVERLAGRVSYDGKGILVGEIELPSHLQRKFLRRCEGYATLQDAVDAKGMYVRGKPDQKTGQKTYWFGLVSGEFRPIPVQAVSTALGRVSSDCTVRYLPKDRFQLHYAVQGSAGQMNLFLDSGELGLYGGNGETAIKLGVSVVHGGAWTLCQYGEQNERVIHRATHPQLDDVMAGLREFAAEVPERQKQSRDVMLGRAEVEAYLTAHAQRHGGMNAVRSILSRMNGSVSAYNLASLVSREAQHLETARVRMERLAGEILLSPERVVQYGRE